MDLAEQERHKYAKIWARPEYHVGSPGERAVPIFLHYVPPARRTTVVDAGCGSGRGAVRLAHAGFEVTCLDFCRTAVEPAAQGFPYIDAVLWEMPPALSFDWVYCVDVLEHIPTEKVDAVLDGLARLATQGGFLQICCLPDNHGSLIGDTLHLTIQKPNWWKPRIAERWPIVADHSTGEYATYVVGAPR